MGLRRPANNVVVNLNIIIRETSVVFLISEQLNEQICNSDPTDPTDKIFYKQALVFLVPNLAGPSPTPELRNTVCLSIQVSG